VPRALEEEKKRAWLLKRQHSARLIQLRASQYLARKLRDRLRVRRQFINIAAASFQHRFAVTKNWFVKRGIALLLVQRCRHDSILKLAQAETATQTANAIILQRAF